MSTPKPQRTKLRLILTAWLLLLLAAFLYTHHKNPHLVNPFRLVQFSNKQTFKMHSSLRARFREDSKWLSKADLNEVYGKPEIIGLLEGSHASPATLAIARNDFDLAQWALTHEVNLNRPDSSGRVPLTYLTSESDEILKMYLDAGALAHFRNPQNTRRVLFYAIQARNPIAVRHLIEASANPRRLDDTHHHHGLHVAAMYPHPDVLDYLLNIPDHLYPDQKLLNPHIPESRTYNTPLHYLMKAEQPTGLNINQQIRLQSITRKWVETTPDLNQQNRFGYTPLHMAVKSQDQLKVILLMDHRDRLDINTKDKRGRTAAMLPEANLFIRAAMDAVVKPDIQPATPQ